MAPMLPTQVTELFDDVLSSRRLLTHRFYRRWEAGTLGDGELSAYAAQYRHFEATLPAVLENVVTAVDDGPARALVQANLDDERGVPVPHIDLFDRFAAALGAPATPPSPAMASLVSLYLSLADTDPAAAVAAVCAYEVQSPAIAVSKAAGLRAHYGLDESATEFWDVHGKVDETHGRWMVEALAALAPDAAAVSGPAVAAADAWWQFLDEREAQASIAPVC